MTAPAPTPLVSVIVPMFNAGATVERCVRSLSEGGLPGDAWECVIVDDGSTDDGPLIAAALAHQDARVRVVRQPNAGLPAARNTGIAHARGNWLRFLDADDWITPGGLAALVEVAEASGTRAACGAARYADESGTDLGWSFRPGVERVTGVMLLESHRFQVGASMVRRDALGDERFADDTQGSEDLDLWLRLALRRGVTWAATQQDVSAYRLRLAGMSRDHAMMARVAARVVARGAAREAALLGDPGERTALTRRAVRRIALERASALAFMHAASHLPSAEPHAALDLWREISAEAGAGLSEAITPQEAASAAHWAVPYADCRPPTAWRDPLRARAYALAMSTWWHALARAGEAAPDLPQVAPAMLAGLLVDPDSVAREIVARLVRGGTRRVVLHGLGRNARELLPRLAATGMQTLGLDDALPVGGTAEIAGVPVDILDPHAARDLEASHVLTTMHAPGLEARFDALRAAPEGGLRIKWASACADASGRERRRLASLWPRADAGPLGVPILTEEAA